MPGFCLIWRCGCFLYLSNTRTTFEKPFMHFSMLLKTHYIEMPWKDSFLSSHHNVLHWDALRLHCPVEFDPDGNIHWILINHRFSKLLFSYAFLEMFYLSPNSLPKLKDHSWQNTHAFVETNEHVFIKLKLC